MAHYVTECVVLFLDCDDTKIDFIFLIDDFLFYVHFINL